MSHVPPAPVRISAVASAGRRAWAALEPMHNYTYFDPGVNADFEANGVNDRRLTYFAARASALGEPGPLQVVAAFYNFAPYTVHWSFPLVWSQIAPARAREVRVEAVDKSLRAVLGDAVNSPALVEAAGLARQAAEAACERPQGRSLFAAHAQLPWPEAPHQQLWHAQTLLREYRGDGHVATLMQAGVSGLKALILFTATEKVDGDQLRLTRGWNRKEWLAAVAELVDDGLLEPGKPWPELEVTEAGRALRQWIEDTTDVLAEHPYSAIGTEGADRLAELSLELNKPVVAADVIPWLRAKPMVTRRARVRERIATRSNLESRSAV